MKTFHHVDVEAQAQRISDVIGDKIPVEMGSGRALRFFAYMNGVADAIEDIDPDVMQVHNRSDIVSFLSKEFPQKPLIAYMHNQPWFVGKRIDESIPNVSKFVFVSHYLRDLWAKEYPGCDESSTVIHNSVDVDRWNPNVAETIECRAMRERFGLVEGKTVLFVGRTIHQKGISVLVDAMSDVQSRVPGAKLLIAGAPFHAVRREDKFLRKLKKRAAKLGDTIQFTGFVPHDETPFLYGASDLLVAPSLWDEPFGKVFTEAMASGIPVVSTRRGAIPEVVKDGETGVLVDRPQDPQTLADAMVALLSDDDLRCKMGSAARDRAVGSFSRKMRLERTQQLYRGM